MAKIVTLKLSANGPEFKAELTDSLKRKVLSAIAETTRKLDKEMRYPEDLRHNDMVEFYNSHIAYLKGIIE